MKKNGADQIDWGGPGLYDGAYKKFFSGLTLYPGKVCYSIDDLVNYIGSMISNLQRLNLSTYMPL